MPGTDREVAGTNAIDDYPTDPHGIPVTHIKLNEARGESLWHSYIKPGAAIVGLIAVILAMVVCAQWVASELSHHPAPRPAASVHHVKSAPRPKAAAHAKHAGHHSWGLVCRPMN